MHIDSIPPATTTSCSPAAIALAPNTTAFSPEPHTLLMVTAPTAGGIPAAIAACRAGAWPIPAGSTQPEIDLPHGVGRYARALQRRPHGDGASRGAGNDANEP